MYFKILKQILFILLIFVFALNTFSCKSDGGKENQSTESSKDETNPEATNDDKEDSSSAKVVKDWKNYPDDGSWVAMVNGKLISTTEFEQFFNMFISEPQTAQQIIPNISEMKRKLVEQLLLIHIVYSRAINDGLIKKSELQLLKSLFAKQGLLRYFFVVEFLLKVNDPTDAELKKFYDNYKDELKSYGVKEFEKSKVALKYMFKRNKAAEKIKNFLGDIRLETQVKENKQLVEDWSDSKIPAEQLKEKNKSDNWIFKIAKNNKEFPFYLSDFVTFVGVELKAKFPDWLIKEITSDPQKKKKYDKMYKNAVMELYDQVLQLEMVFQYAVEKQLQKNKDAQDNINLMMKSGIVDKYVQLSVMKKLKDISPEEIDEIFNDKERKKEISEFIEKQFEKSPTDDEIKEAIRQNLLSRKQMQMTEDILKAFMGEEQIRIGKAYFDKENEKDASTDDKPKAQEETAVKEDKTEDKKDKDTKPETKKQPVKDKDKKNTKKANN